MSLSRPLPPRGMLVAAPVVQQHALQLSASWNTKSPLAAQPLQHCRFCRPTVPAAIAAAVFVCSRRDSRQRRGGCRAQRPRGFGDAFEASARPSLESRDAIKRCLRENRGVQVLAELPEDALQQILDEMTRLEVPPGHQLCLQGEQGTAAMLVVEAGLLKVSKRLTVSDDQEVEVSQLGPGSLVGELALLYDEPCVESVTVAGERPAVLWQLRREAFLLVIGRLARVREQPAEVECVIYFDNIESAPEPKSVFVVSDGTGRSAAGAVELALKQFALENQGCGGANVTTFKFVRYTSEVLEITRRARAEQAMVVYTLMRPEPREAMRSEAMRPLKDGEQELRATDLWEPMLGQMEVLLGHAREPTIVPQLRPALSDACLKMVAAIEFTRKMDDGVHPELWKEADLILIGLSRAGKTPLSFFLAQRGLKVANYPVVPDEDPPDHLFDPAIQVRCIALTISAQRLQAVRTERMVEFGRSKSEYSSLINCEKEVSWLTTFYKRRGARWPVLDTTNGGVEENAAKILKLLENHGVLEKSASPSVC